MAKAKARREPSAAERRYRREMATIRRQAGREWRAREAEAALAKDKIGSPMDVMGVYFALSGKAREQAVYQRILELSYAGLSPRQIVETMDPKRPRRNGKTQK